jgi:hypothetical protein
MASEKTRPGAKDTMAVGIEVKTALAGLMEIKKKINIAETLLREEEKKGYWGNCILTAQSISNLYSQLVNQYRAAAIAIGKQTASRPGAKDKMAVEDRFYFGK